jgi:hypothetical protein
MIPRRLIHYIENFDSPSGYLLSDPNLSPLVASWNDAESHAVAAYEIWAFERDRESYAVYRAYADQADAAQDRLAAASGGVVT